MHMVKCSFFHYYLLNFSSFETHSTVQSDNIMYDKFGNGKKHSLFAGTRAAQCQGHEENEPVR